MENISLKRATLEDSEVIFDFEKATNSKTYFGFTKKEEIIDYITNSTVFIVQKDGSDIGVASYENKGIDQVSFNGLVVKPEYRGQGIGTKVMKMMLEGLRDKKRIDLVVHPHNSSAIQVYLSLGFVVESWKDNYFGDGEPRLILVYQK